MTTSEMFLKLVEEINDEFIEFSDEEVYPQSLMEYRTDGSSCAICYLGDVFFTEDDIKYDWEEVGDPRYGKDEYLCLKEDVFNELIEIKRSFDNLISVYEKMLKKG